MELTLIKYKVNRAYKIAFLLLMGGLLFRPLLAETISVEDVMVRQQWNNEGDFLVNWTDAKVDFNEELIRSLVSAHVVDTSSGPSLRQYPNQNLFRQQINQTWIMNASHSLHDYEVADAKFYLTQLSPPLTDIETQWVNSLKVSIHLSEGGLLEARTLIENGNFSSFFQNISNIQLAQFLIENNDIEPLEDILSSMRLESEQLKLERQSITANLALKSNNSDGKKLLDSIKFDDEVRKPLQYFRFDAALESNNNHDVIEILLELVNSNRKGNLSFEQVELLKALEDESALFQLIEFGNRWASQLTTARAELLETQKKYLKPEFHQSIISRDSTTFNLNLVAELGENSRWLAEEIARTNTIKLLVEKNIKQLEAYTQLLEKGSKHVANELKIFPDVLTSEGAEYPQDVINRGPEVLLFERLLSRFIGDPEPWEQRYAYLDGLSLWHTGKAFRKPWWKDGNLSIRSATIELRRLMAKRKAQIEKLNEERWSSSKDYMLYLHGRATASLTKLNEARRDLDQAFSESLTQEFSDKLNKIESEMLWLANKVLPNANNIDSKESQPYFQLVRDARKNGQLKLSVNNLVKPLPGSENLFNSLVVLSSEANEKQVKLSAMSHLGGLAIEVAEVKSFTSDQRIQSIPVDADLAIDLFSKLAEQETEIGDVIRAYYQLARALEFQDNTQATIVQLEKIESLATDYELRDEILFRLGEALFGEGDYDLAAQSYFTLSDQFPQSAFVNNANYMLGWSYFKQADYHAALNHFFKLVDYYWYAQDTDQEVEKRLVEDTMRVIGMTFANMDGANSVKKFFANLGDKPYGEQIYADLGEYYEDKLRFTDAAITFESIVEIYPDVKKAPFYQSRVVKAYVDGQFPSKAWPAKETYVQYYGKDSLRWMNSSADERKNVLEFLPDYLSDLAKREHAKAQNSQLKSDYSHAIDWYDHFIAIAPNVAETPEIYFLRGEALTEIGEHEEAAESYQQTAYGFVGYERADEAAYAALLSYQKLYNQTRGQKKKAWLELGIQKSEQFVTTFDSPKYRPLVQTKLAEDMLLREDNVKALQFAEGLLEQKESGFTPAMQLRLWRVAAHASYELNQFAKAETGYQKAIDLSVDPTELVVLLKRKIESIYRQAEVAKADNKLADAVFHFLRVGSEYPDSEIRANAEFDAATVLIIMEDWDQALTILTRFNQLYPIHELQGLMLEKLVVVYENLESWALAAQTLNTIYEREGNSALGRNALWRSASLQNKAGNPEKSINLFKRYVKTFPLPLEPASEARNEMHLIYVAKQNVESSEYWLKQNILAQDNNKSKSTGRTLYLASEASLTMGRKDYDEFSGINLTLPLEKSLGKKQLFMEQSINHLSKTLEYGLAEHSTEATALMGDLYAKLASSLMSSERPGELNALELEQYELLLEEQVFPFEDQALELYEVNVGWIREEIYTPWVQYSLDQLKAILPARYDKPEEVPLYADSIQ